MLRMVAIIILPESWQKTASVCAVGNYVSDVTCLQGRLVDHAWLPAKTTPDKHVVEAKQTLEDDTNNVKYANSILEAGEKNESEL